MFPIEIDFIVWIVGQTDYSVTACACSGSTNAVAMVPNI